MLRRTVAFLVCVPLLSASVRSDDAAERRLMQSPPTSVVQTMVYEYCVDCHYSDEPAAGFDLESVVEDSLALNGGIWEKAVRQLRARQMPPGEAPRPDESTYVAALDSLEKRQKPGGGWRVLSSRTIARP